MLAQALKRNFLAPILEFIYPPICLACGGHLDPQERLVCENCWNGIEKVRTEDALYHEFVSKLRIDGAVTAVISAFYFEKDSKLQSIIHAIKYDGYHSLGVKAGRFVGERIAAEPLLSKSDFLIPVPLHSIKKRERGYNQSEYICRGIREVTGIPVRTDLLEREKYTVSQTQLTFEERQKNVGDAFRINARRRDEIAGRSFILVDDVITTGSTINACAKELRNAGTRDVHAAAIALAK